MRVCNDVSGAPLKPEFLEIGQLVNAEPEIFYNGEPYGVETITGHEQVIEKTKAPIVVVRMEPDDITPSKGREDWGVDGILAYSKICTHVGCPISLWEQQTHHLLCPCHQSTFDLADNGKVIFGPAGRSLPQLPLMVDDEGYLVAQSDFTEPVGPSFWERGER
jgi:ubiquinol-cytochrome c reductase iron-sulfur subunit